MSNKLSGKEIANILGTLNLVPFMRKRAEAAIRRLDPDEARSIGEGLETAESASMDLRNKVDLIKEDLERRGVVNFSQKRKRIKTLEEAEELLGQETK